jgi:HEAT repeat protein
MARYIPPRTLAARALVAAAALLACLLPARPALAQQPSEAIRDLRDALAIGATDTDLTKQKLEQRREALDDAVKEVRTVNDLYQALVLPDWKDGPSDLTINPRLFELDRAARSKVKDRLLAALRAGLRDNKSKTSVATFIGQMGLALRSGTVNEPFGVTGPLTADLVRLTEDPDPKVQQAAARALGEINPTEPPDPDTGKEGPQRRLAEVSAALRRLLTRAPDVATRRAAASALSELIRTMVDLQNTAQTEIRQKRFFVGAGAGPEDVIRATAEVVGLAGRGADDSDAGVRLLSLQAIALAASELDKRLPSDATEFFKNQLKQSPFPKFLFVRPPSRRSATGKEILALRGQVAGYLKQFDPLTAALGGEGKVLADHLRSENADIRLASRRALEAMASARQRVQRLWEFLPPLADGGAAPAGGGVEEEQDEVTPLLKGLLPALDVLSGGLNDPDAAIRLKAAEFLEMMGRQAEPAVPVLVKALCDPDSFVRWTASRALAQIAPARPGVVVPALARALSDPDLDARTAAAQALEHYGLLGRLSRPALAKETEAVLARAAVPALARAAQVGDAEARVAAIQALTAVVDGGAGPAVDALIAALENPDLRVRRGAADALGRVRNPAAQRAIPALTAALADPDDEVRRLAAASLLTIRERARSGL